MEFSWGGLKKRTAMQLGKDTFFYFFFASGENLRKASLRAVNEASGTAMEYNPETGKAQEVTFTSKLTSVNWAGSYLLVILGTKTDAQIREMIESGELSKDEVQKVYEEGTAAIMQEFRKEMANCHASR